MGKLEPIERIIRAPERVRIVRCLVCGRPLDHKERTALVHPTCKANPPKPD